MGRRWSGFIRDLWRGEVYVLVFFHRVKAHFKSFVPRGFHEAPKERYAGGFDHENKVLVEGL